MSTLKKLATAGIAAAALVGASLAWTAPADARAGGWGGHHGGGMMHGGWGGGRHFGGGWGGGRHFGGGWGGHRRFGGGWGYGGLGLASGLAFGALAASSYPYGYGYGYAPAYYGGYGGGYYNAGWGGEDDCYIQRRKVWGPYGLYIQRVRVCY